MATEQKGFLQSVIGGLGMLIDWTKEQLADEVIKQSILVDLGLDPNSEIDIPEDSTSNIAQYQESVDPDQEALEGAEEDLFKIYTALTDSFTVVKDGRNPDEIFWQFFNLMSTNYVKHHYPKVFYTGQLLGFLDEVTNGLFLSNILSFSINPIGYIKNIGKYLKRVAPSGLDTTEDVETWSFLLFGLAGVLTFLKDDIGPEIRFLQGWDVLPEKFTPEKQKGLQASIHGERLIERLQKSHPTQFPANQTKAASWIVINTALNNPSPEKIDQQIIEAYQRAVSRFKRGSWADMISESAFSFDLPLSGGQQHVGASLFLVSSEDAPTDIKDDGKKVKASGGLFLSLNGDAQIERTIKELWDIKLAIDSGDILDLFIELDKKPKHDFGAFGDLQLKLSLKRKINEKIGASYNIPNNKGTRLALGEISIHAFMGKGDRGLELGFKDNRLLIESKEGDSFISEVLPKEEISLDFSFAIGFSKERRIYFNQGVSELIDLIGDIAKSAQPASKKSVRGGPRIAKEAQPKKQLSEEDTKALDALFPINKKMGLLDFESIDWRFGKISEAGRLGAHLNVLTTFNSKLGPVYFKVVKIGAGFEFSVPDEGGDMSKARWKFGFNPPTGVAIRVDSSVITGGGFLDLDYENNRYAGALALAFGRIELAAVGLISTRLPNNQKGFSMLLSISTIFEPSFKLPYNFSLNGVGGIIGIHRTMNVAVLRQRIEDGAITNIMFPKNVIANASKIISDLRTIFPPKKKHYVVAPFVRIGWGTPNIIEADLGIFMEFPFKGRLILLGSVGVYLPSKQVSKKLVELHIDIFGDFNFAESYVLIEGRLRDSHVAGINLTGGFAFVLDWGQQPQFLFSVGGYHPRYKKPDRFPAIPRLTAKIKKGDNITLTCQYYQAITSNSYQIGFSAELIIKKGKARATGFLGFNALIQFDPFYFETDVRISIDVSYRGRSFAGVELYFLLSGPKPWRAKGYARIKVWFFSLKIKFDYEWGGKQEVAKSIIRADELLVQLKQQLQANDNWKVELPPLISQAVTLRSLEPSEQDALLLVHPSGYLELRQNLIPLNRSIEKMGNSFVSDQPTYNIQTYQFGEASTPDNIPNPIRAHFSRGQFEELTDSEKIAARDFEMMEAGIQLNASEVFDFATTKASTDNGYEDILLTNSFEGEATLQSTLLSKTRKGWQTAVARIGLDHHKGFNSKRPEEKFRVVEKLPDYQEASFRIVSKEDLSFPLELGDRQFISKSEAKDYLRQHLPKGEKKWQIREIVAEGVF